MALLYEFPPTRSNRVKWALEEVGAPYARHTVDLLKGEQDSDAYRAIHPLGVVPAYETDRYRMFESVAILLQLLDEHPASGLAPAVGSAERAAYYQWCVFAGAEMDPAIMLVFDNTMRPLEGMRPPGAKHEPALAERGRYEFSVRAQAVSDTLDKQDYLLGDTFSGADIAIGHSCFMAAHTGLLGDYPVLQDYYARLGGRPAHKRVYDG